MRLFTQIDHSFLYNSNKTVGFLMLFHLFSIIPVPELFPMRN